MGMEWSIATATAERFHDERQTRKKTICPCVWQPESYQRVPSLRKETAFRAVPRTAASFAGECIQA